MCNFHLNTCSTYIWAEAIPGTQFYDEIKFMCENKDLHEYEEAKSVNNATANLFVVSNEFGREFHFIRITFSAQLSTTKKSLPANSIFISSFCQC